MDDKIIGIHHRCGVCNYAFIEQPDEDGLFGIAHKSCPADGYRMGKQDIWNKSNIMKEYSGVHSKR